MKLQTKENIFDSYEPTEIVIGNEKEEYCLLFLIESGTNNWFRSVNMSHEAARNMAMKMRETLEVDVFVTKSKDMNNKTLKSIRDGQCPTEFKGSKIFSEVD